MTKLKDQVFSVAKFAKDTAMLAAQGESVKVTPEEATRRYNLCVACPQFLKDSQKCDICKCPMGFKVQWQASRCADKLSPKW